MAYFYVKNTGTATGDGGRYASQQTGSFAGLGATTTFYSNVDAAEAATTPPVAGDFVLSSDLSVHSGAVSINIGLTGVIYMSVDDTNIDASRTTGNRASEENTGVSDIFFTNVFISGMSFISADNCVFSEQNRFEDSAITVTGSTDIAVSMAGDGYALVMLDVTINVNNSSGLAFIISRGGSVSMVGGAILTTSAGITNMSSGGFTQGGGSMYFEGVDLSGVTGTLIANVGSDAANDNRIDIRGHNCKLSSGVAFSNEVFKNQNQSIIFTNSSFTSATAEYQFYTQRMGGVVNDNTAIFRNEDDAFLQASQKVSYKIETNADADALRPFWFEFPISKLALLSSTATDNLKFYITCATALTNKDIYITVTYPEQANKQTPTIESSVNATVGGTIDLLATGTTLTTDAASSWTGALANLYEINIPTVSNPGADCIPVATVYVTKPSTTIYIASEYGTD